MAFDISNMSTSVLNNIDKILETKNTEFEIKNINIKDIKRNNKNFYEIKDIDELAEDIKINGLYHNILVREIESSKETSKTEDLEETPKYELISGERRLSAFEKLVKDGNRLYNIIPCKVIKVNDEDTEILLIQANAQTRELTDIEKLLQVEKLEALYQKKKNRGEKIPGGVQKHIAEKLRMSEATTGRMQKINNNLIDELKIKINEGKLSISNANEFASLSENKQKIVKEILDKNEQKLSKQKAKELKHTLSDLNDDEINKTDIVNDIKKEFIKSQPNIIHTKELDLSDKIKKLNNIILKLTEDLDKKNIIKLKEGIDLLDEFEANTESLLLKIKEKRV